MGGTIALRAMPPNSAGQGCGLPSRYNSRMNGTGGTVWHFANFDRGGIARFIEQLVTAQARLHGDGDLKFGVFGPPGLQLPTVTPRRQYRPIRSIWGLNQWKFALQALLQVTYMRRSANHPGLIHAHNGILQVADIYTAHGYYTKNWLSKYDRLVSPMGFKRTQFRLLSALERRMLKRSRVVVFASSENRDYAENALGIRRRGGSIVVNPGVDTSLFNPMLRRQLVANRQSIFPGIQTASRWLVFVGNDFAGKGLLRMLESLAYLQPPTAWDMLVFGDDRHNRRALEELGKQTKGGHLHVFGEDGLLAAAYGLSDVFAMDSISEGFPLTLLEAMASGCVPITTRFGGVSDIVRDGYNGYIRDSAADVVRSALACDREELVRLGARAAELARSRSWDEVAKAYDEIYYDLLGRGRLPD